jgi:hypothetical protein
MTKLNILSALAALAIAGSPAGCSLGDVSGPTVGDGDGDGDGDNGDGDGTTDEGAEIFENDVKPLIATCAGEACHSGTFAQPLKFLGTGSPADYYSSIVTFASVTGNFDPALANMILMVKDPVHQASAPIAVPWSSEQEDLIANWLLFERDARGIDGEDPIDEPEPGAAPTSTEAAFAQWAGCMSRENWDLANMGNWANKGSDEGPCRGCHNQGAYRFFANGENARMFDMNRTELYILSFFKAAVDDEGAVSVVPAVSKFERMSLGTPITNHPEFNSSPDNNQMESLQQFYELTLADLEAGNCGPAEFYVP